MKRVSDFVVLGIQVILGYLFAHSAGEIANNSVLIVFSLGLIAIAIFVGLKAFLDIKTNFAVAPEPHSSASLVTSGIYSKIRHPMYSAIIFTALGYLLIRFSVAMAGFFLVIVIFFIVKIYFEDRFLMERYSEYRQYRSRTKALVPYLW